MTDQADTDRRAAVTYGVDKGAPNGDKTALTIKRGDTLYTYVGEEAEVILALIDTECLAVRKRDRDKIRLNLPEPMHPNTHGIKYAQGFNDAIEAIRADITNGKEG